MKLFIFLLVLSLNAAAEIPAQMTTVWTTSGLNDAELQTLDESGDLEMRQITTCMKDHNETEIASTSCINEVFGDVHN